MSIVRRIDAIAEGVPGKIAHRYRSGSLSYGELRDKSDALANFLQIRYPDNRPIIVFGHKQCEMVLCFIACAKAGHPYIPVDSSLPAERLAEIVVNSCASVLLGVEDTVGLSILHDVAPSFHVLGRGELTRILREYAGTKPERRHDSAEIHPYYIIYTSGSTGKPKGVQIPESALESFVAWGSDFLKIGADEVFLNQANFSFDLSVADLYLSLCNGGTLHSLDREQMSDYKEFMADLGGSGITIWVSTPSFANMALFDKAFGRSLLPELRSFFFCGETLPNSIAERLRQRFPGANVFNTYGPTEATVAVTQVLIDGAVLAGCDSLPVGTIKPGCEILILDGSGGRVPEGIAGEIVIVGDSVGTGYVNSEEATKMAFFNQELGGKVLRAYRTGDEGWLESGMLHYKGRMDFQVKLHGYRIELGDIESNLRKLRSVADCLVVPHRIEGQIDYLVAFVALSEGFEETGLKAILAIKDGLRNFVPDYMVPKRIVIKGTLPMTANGKADRKLLEAEANQ
ncbi:MAG: D-alanine--poly(phosphoribitol) ligase subunit DltA [Spirochaetota bacterium]